MQRATLPIFFLAAGIGLGADPTSENYKEQYVKKTFGPKALLRSVASGTLGEITNSPKEWGRGIDGFGKRIASGLAGHVVKNSITYPIAAALHEDLQYHRSTSERFAPRLGHALVSVVITQKTTTGRNTFAVGQVSGAFGTGLISRAWQPAAARSLGDGFASGGISLGGQAAINVIREFWPRHKKTVVPTSAHGANVDLKPRR